MDGKQQTDTYAALAGELFMPGDLVDIRTLGRAEVQAVLPGGMLRVRTAQRCPVMVRAADCKQFISNER